MSIQKWHKSETNYLNEFASSIGLSSKLFQIQLFQIQLF